MELSPNALSSDGYIIDQRQTRNIPFGAMTSDKNGCGWIALYNLLHALGRDPDPEQIVTALEKTLLFHGVLGLNLFALVWALKKQKLPLHVALRAFHAQQLAEQCTAGIILYYTGRRNHFVAFRREDRDTLRFFGAVPGCRRHETTMTNFYWDYVKFPLAVTITV